MQTQQKKQLSEELNNLLIRIPLWVDEVWEPLQKKEYKNAMDSLYTLMGHYTHLTVLDIYWKYIIEGGDQVRGNLTKEEWEENIVPYLSSIILQISDETLFEKIYFSLEPETLRWFHISLVTEIPGFTLDEKIDYLKDEKPWMLKYFTGSPLNAFGEGLLIPVSETAIQNHVEDLEKYWKAFPPALKFIFFSIYDAKIISELCSDYELDNQKTVNMAHIIGAVLLGELKIEKFEELVKKITGLDSKRLDDFTEELRILLIDSLEDDINTLKQGIESVVEEEETPVPITAEEEGGEVRLKINKVEFPEIQEEIKEQPKNPDAPFIIHTEKSFTDTDKNKKSTSPFSKGFSLPFGFFKSKLTQKEKEQNNVQVKIETADGEKQKKTGGKIKVSKTILKKENVSVENKNDLKNGVFGVISENMKNGNSKHNELLNLPPRKIVHYSDYKTEVDENPPKPHVEGNIISFM